MFVVEVLGIVTLAMFVLLPRIVPAMISAKPVDYSQLEG